MNFIFGTTGFDTDFGAGFDTGFFGAGFDTVVFGVDFDTTGFGAGFGADFDTVFGAGLDTGFGDFDTGGLIDLFFLGFFS